jgi:hypothetical protein
MLRGFPVAKALVLAAAVLAAGLFAGCDRSPVAETSDPAPKATYRVTGGVDQTVVWYVGEGNERTIETVRLPWEHTVPAGDDAILHVRAGRDRDDPPVTVSLETRDTTREARAGGPITEAGVVSLPDPKARVRYKVDNTAQSVDTLRQTIETSRGALSEVFTRPDTIPPNTYPDREDRLQPDTTLSVNAPFSPRITLGVSPQVNGDISLLGSIYVRPEGYPWSLLLRHAQMPGRRSGFELEGQVGLRTPGR